MKTFPRLVMLAVVLLVCANSAVRAAVWPNARSSPLASASGVVGASINTAKPAEFDFMSFAATGAAKVDLIVAKNE